MKKALKITGIILGSLLALIITVIVVTMLTVSLGRSAAAERAMALASDEVKTISADGFTFRDLNKNGSLDIYEDTRKSPEERAGNLISQMTLEEKAGTMFFSMISMRQDGSIAEKPSINDPFSFAVPGTSDMIFSRHITHFNILAGTGKKEMATWNNNIQKLAERTRLGIPVTIGTDPRNQYSNNPLAAMFAGDFSLWPEPLGLAATGDSLLTARFADIARREYLATGIRVALHPMADLATEPRWGRINGTFGEDAALSSKLTYAYIRGFQGDSIGPWSVSCMTKHFSGGGPQKEGLDPHFPFAKGQVYPENNFNYHLLPFEAAFRAGTAEIMPYYGVPMGQTSEDVGFSFNKDIITGMLRGKYGFEGVVCTDWGIITDTKMLGKVILPARARGMENATPEERMIKCLNAGIDQFGGETCPDLLVKIVKDGKISESRLDESVRRILLLQFRLGLFDNPFTDPENAVKIVGNDEFIKEGRLAQRRSAVLLKNDTISGKAVLPLKKGMKIYAFNLDTAVVSRYGTIVSNPAKADIAIIRLRAPSYPVEGGGLLSRLFSSGDLDFKGKELQEILDLLKKVPSVVDIYLDRPAVIPEIASASKGLLANFGASDDAILDIIFGDFNPSGRLPLELPSSMEAVRNQKEDLPYDSKEPLFPFGFGLSYQQ